jgi:hypothetical protein
MVTSTDGHEHDTTGDTDGHADTTDTGGADHAHDS